MGKIYMTLPLLGLMMELSKSKYILSAVVSNRLFWGGGYYYFMYLL